MKLLIESDALSQTDRATLQGLLGMMTSATGAKITIVEDEAPAVQPIDLNVTQHGDMVVVKAETPAAVEWARKYVDPVSQPYLCYPVEVGEEYAGDLVHFARLAGLNVA